MKVYTFYFLKLGNLYRSLSVSVLLNYFWPHGSRTCKLLKEKILSQEDIPLNVLQYVSDFRSKLLKACEAAKSNLKSTQSKMKQNYDKNTKERSFKSGDKVLAFCQFLVGHFKLDILVRML